MNTLEFFHKVLPARGLYIAARLTNKGFRNDVCETLEELEQQVLMADAQGVHSYHACAAYRDRSVATTRPDGSIWHQVRTHANVRACKAFWMDLDVEPGNPKKFESQDAALDGVIAFCRVTHLPMPMLINSGYGVHCYFVLTEEIQSETWKQTAESLKALCAHHKFRADPACTGDLARVLRPVGTWNRKETTPRNVELVADSTPVDYQQFNALVLAGIKAVGLKPPETLKAFGTKAEAINEQFAISREFPPCSIVKVAERCAQIQQVRDTRGNVSEPLWYGFIQTACHSIEGDPTIHEWSRGHPTYSDVETTRKIMQIRSQSLGPTLCTTFESRNPGGCAGCPFLNKISSPAQLGAQVEAAPPPEIQTEVAGVITTVTLINPPEPFKRSKDGITIEEDGITHMIHRYDAYPTELAYDEQLGYETMRWRHFLKNDGWKECTLRSALLTKPADFAAAMLDNHVQPLIGSKFLMYASAYVRELREGSKLRRLFKSQGWKTENTEFVLGDKLYRKDEVVQAGFSHGLGQFLEPFKERGNLGTWRDLTSVFDHPGFEAHAFMLLLAFAAPLIQLGKFEGCTVNALGDSNAGKTTMAKLMCSVYSDPKGTWVGRKDSELARMQRLGAHCNLPVYMDEVTTIKPEPLRDLIYGIPTGKNRATMKADYSFRPGAEWNTLFVTSSNDSLQSTLQLEKANPEAEALRLIEFRFPRVADFKPIANIISDVTDNHYGVAGPVYIRHLVQNREAILANLDKTNSRGVVAETVRRLGMDDKERFWSWTIALALYGGRLAREAGVISFDPDRITPWLQAETRQMRGLMTENYTGSVAVLAAFLNEHVGERLVVSAGINANMAATDTRLYHKLSQRYETDTKTLWIAWNSLREDWGKKHINPQAVQDELMAKGILLDPKGRCTLGKGTQYSGGAVRSWQINAAHSELIGVLPE